ncbi:MAG: transposase [Pseudomonadota bacterium]
MDAVEKEARGLPPDERVRLHQDCAKPVLDDLEAWLAVQLTPIPGKSELAKAVRYALTRTRKLRPYHEHGFLEIDDNSAEQGDDGCGYRTEETPLRRLRARRKGRRNRLSTDRNRQTGPRRSAGTAHRGPWPHRRPRDHPAGRPHALAHPAQSAFRQNAFNRRPN